MCMIKRIISLSIAGALTLCALANPAYAANNEETARKIAAIFAEQEEKSQQKLNIESRKRQKLEDENKALLEELRNLKAEKENKELQNEIEKLKANNKKTSSSSAKLVNGARGVLGLIFCVSGLGVIAAAGGYAKTVIKAWWECRQDSQCNSYSEKIDANHIFNLINWHNLSVSAYNISHVLLDLLKVFSGDKK